MIEVQENIKKFRELKNLTREQVSSKLDMSLSGYSKLERGEVEISINKLYKIAEVLEVSVSQMLNFDTSQIFNFQNNQTVGAVSVKEQENNYYTSKVTEKYIEMLENEVARLRELK